MNSLVFRRGTALLLFVALLLIGTLLGTAWRRSHPAQDAPVLTVTFLDVGDGDCTLVQSPEGRTILVDAGNTGDGPAVTALLRRRNVRTIDLLILTSPEADSVGGVPALLSSGVRVSQVWDNAVAQTGEARRASLAAIRRRHIPSTTVSAGNAIQVGGRLFVSALWPPPTGEAARRDPLLCRLNYGSTAFLLEASATDESERALISQAGPEIGCTGVCTDLVLQVATHTENSPSPELLRRATPAIAVFSCGPGTTPSLATLHRLQAAGADVWRTDTQGTVTVTTGGQVSPSVTATHLQ